MIHVCCGQICVNLTMALEEIRIAAIVIQNTLRLAEIALSGVIRRLVMII